MIVCNYMYLYVLYLVGTARSGTAGKGNIAVDPAKFLTFLVYSRAISKHP